MKNLLLLFVLCYGLQFTSCKTTTTGFATPQYPRYAELHHGNYGTSMYSTSTPHRQAMERILFEAGKRDEILGKLQLKLGKTREECEIIIARL